MKKNNIDFESQFWSGRCKLSPVALGDVFFQFHDLATAKERLNLMMQYAVQGKTRIPEDPSVVFHFHQSLRSLIRAGWCLREMDRRGRSGDRQSADVRFAFGGRIPRSGPGIPSSL